MFGLDGVNGVNAVVGLDEVGNWDEEVNNRLID